MQLPLLPGSLGPVLLTDDSPIARRAITQPFSTTGLQFIGAMVELDAQVVAANVNGKLLYRFWATDNSDSATAWTAFGGSATSTSRKVYASSNAVAGSGNLFCQLGLEVERTGLGSGVHAIAYLRYPVAVY